MLTYDFNHQSPIGRDDFLKFLEEHPALQDVIINDAINILYCASTMLDLPYYGFVDARNRIACEKAKAAIAGVQNHYYNPKDQRLRDLTAQAILEARQKVRGY